MNSLYLPYHIAMFFLLTGMLCFFFMIFKGTKKTWKRGLKARRRLRKWKRSNKV